MAIDMIKSLTATELDASYLGRVERIMDFGAFIGSCLAWMGCCMSWKSRTTASRTSVTTQGRRADHVIWVTNVDLSGKVRLSRKACSADEGPSPGPRPRRSWLATAASVRRPGRPGPRRAPRRQ